MITRKVATNDVLKALDEVFLQDMFWENPATIDENAPLALIQCSLEEKARLCCLLLGISFSQAKEEFEKNGRLAK
jgi:hypothetical protein